MKISDLMQDRKETGGDCVACAVYYISVFHEEFIYTCATGKISSTECKKKKTQFKFKACKVIFNFYRSVFGANNLILLLMIQLEEV